MTTFISHRQGVFTLYDHYLGKPDWTGKRVLDFGGNVGNTLLDPNCRIDPRNYWSIDISRDAIIEGQRRHPAAHFVFYDRYSYEYNPGGTVGLPVPDPGVRFDVIMAESVVTHINKAETLELVDQLMALLTEDGTLAYTFIDPRWTPPAESAHEYEGEAAWSNLLWMLEKLHANRPDMDVAGLLAQGERATLTWATLVGSDKLVVDPDDDGLPAENGKGGVDFRRFGYINFCTTEYMSRLFPNVQISPPLPPRRLHCAILHAQKGTGR